MTAASLSLILVAGSLLAQESKGKREPAARVVSAEQGWTVGRLAVARGTPLSALDVLIGGANATALVLECGPAGWLAYECGTRPCRVPVCTTKIDGVNVMRSDPGGANIRASTSGTPESRGLLDTLFRRQPKDPVTLGVRSGGNPSDAVVLRDSRGVHWGPALNRILDGSYCFRLSSLPASGTARVFTLAWDRSIEPEGFAAVPGVAPGLYAIDKGLPGSNATCRADPDASTAWVLISGEADFPRVNAAWNDYSAWFNHLEQSGTGPSIVATVRHAVLASLADSLQPGWRTGRRCPASKRTIC